MRAYDYTFIKSNNEHLVTLMKCTHDALRTYTKQSFTSRFKVIFFTYCDVIV